VSETLLPDLPELLAKWSAEAGVPTQGVSVGILSGDQVAVHVHGLANVATETAVHPDTVFQIGSNTKLWTATTVMKLVDEGRISLDESVTTYVPEFRLAHVEASTVTIRHLLTHTGGFLGDYFGGPGTDSIATFVEEMAELPQLHPVGEMWSYCNSGWVLLGRVIEKVTGQSYDVAMRALVLDAIGDTHTYVRAEDIVPLRAAVGYTLDPEAGELKALPYGIMPPCAPAGSVPVSSPADVLRFVKLHLDKGKAEDGTQVLSEETAGLMTTHHVDIPAGMGLRTYGMGLGWMLRHLADGQEVIGHGGATPSGFFSLLEVVPGKRLAVLVLTNGPAGPTVGSKAVEYVLQELAGSTLKQEPLVWPEPALALDWELYAGQYGDANATFDIRPAEGQPGLTVTMTPIVAEDQPAPPPQTMPLFALSEQNFAPPLPGVDSVMQFLGMDADGRPGYFFMGRLYPRKA